MKGYEFTHVKLRDTIAVGQTERLIRDVRCNALDASSRQSFQTSIDENDPPLFGWMTEEFDVVFFEIDLKVIVFGEIVNKIIFNELPLTAAADDEIIGPGHLINSHHMPQDWLGSDLDQRLGACEHDPPVAASGQASKLSADHVLQHLLIE